MMIYHEMRKRLVRSCTGAAVIFLAGTGVCHADFKYTESTKITGGALVGITKSLGVFSKDARQAMAPQLSSTMVKGNVLRREQADGSVSIIDLDGRRFITIDQTKKVYSVMTFDDFKAAMQRAQARVKDQQATVVAQHPEAANVKLTPKIHSEETGATRTILNLPTSEVKWRLDMEMQSTDPKLQQQNQSATMTMTSDSWMAASIPGYDEMRQFYLRLAKELDWLPGAMGMSGMNSQMGPAVEEFRKNAIKLKGMPLLTTMSFIMSATGAPPPGAAQSGQSSQTATTASNNTPAPQSRDSDTQPSMPTSAKDAVAKGLGGMFGGFKKKKQQPPPAGADASQDAPGSLGTGPSQPSAASNSLMDMQTEVTGYSSAALEKSLFDIPQGYTRVEPDPNRMMGVRK